MMSKLWGKKTEDASSAAEEELETKGGYTTLTLIVFIPVCHPLCRAAKLPSSTAYRMTESIWFNFTLFCSLS